VSERGRKIGVNCKEFIALLGDYLEMTVRPEIFAELEEHLANCPPCQVYLRTYRRTREIAGTSEREALPPAMPEEMKSRLRAFLLAQLLADES
jgi:predicted anti-sigma-YlaC factor YlaD